MAVKKKTIPSVDSFIDKGADVKAVKDKNFKNILLRVPTGILGRIDELIKEKPWINRTQWIIQAVYDKLTEEVH